MKKFLKFMSPFAPDQSGACGVFYELGGLIIICDAGGCAGNICGFDEPRWFEKKSAVFSAGLRDMDAIMGRDDKLIQKLALSYEQLGGKFALIVSTPVPAIIATDFRSLERMGEKKINVPCIALDCTGTGYYDKGEEKAWYRLFETFAKESFEKVEGKIGVIGATPIETGYKDAEILRQFLADNKELLNAKNSEISKYTENTVIYSMGSTLEDVIRASECEKNIVISLAGLKAAKYLEDKFGTPYEIAYPFIPEHIIKEAKNYSDKNILIIRSQFAANELRNAIGNTDKIKCATWFMQDNEYTLDGDIKLSGEDDLTDLLEKETFDLIIADEDALPLIKSTGYNGDFLDYPEFAVSGRLLV